MTQDERIQLLEREAKVERSHALDMAVRAELAQFTFRNPESAQCAFDAIRAVARRSTDGLYVAHGRPLAEHVRTKLTELVGLLEPLPGEQTAQPSYFRDFDINSINNSMTEQQKLQATEQILRALGR